ncbi:MAG: histidine kinase [Actinomycetia bacterium]|nr:histidine kinase [Actinomycetes bacterium]
MSGQSRESEAARTIEQLTSSRRRVVEAYEVERRRIERDLHDGAQQYLVAAALKLGEARLAPAVQAEPGLATLLAEAGQSLADGLAALRRTVRGIHPQVLSEQGLAAALTEVAATAANPVRVVCPHPLPDLPEAVLAVGYFVACEAVTNAAKYAPGAPVSVLLGADERLRISVVDQGPGGAQVVAGHGLAGLVERLAAFGGELQLTSPAGGPTRLVATIPLLLHRGEPGVRL